MNQVAACPSAELLQRILSGQATPAEGEAFGVHLETCPTCADALDRALTGDTLVDAMRSQSTVEDRSEPALPSLIDRLLQLRVKRVSSATVDFSAGGTQAPKSLAAAAHEVLSPPQSSDELGRLGTFRVLKVLGAGGMGLVYQAEDVHLKRKVALKVMKPGAAAQPGARDRFLREAQAAAAIEHEHIVTIHHVGEENGVPFVAMQWLKGMSLDDALKKGPLKPGQIVRVARQIALGLAAAHEHGLIHRDIKPANLWIEPTGGGKVKILDFGLARALHDELHLTQSGAIIGTPAYMAPEQARGDKVDHRCDLFSLGVVLYRMATGKMPFRGESHMALLTSLALDTPPSPREVNPAVPAKLSDLIVNLMEKDPARRMPTARAVADRLGKIGQQLAKPTAAESGASDVPSALMTAPATAPAQLPPPKHPSRRWPLLVGGLLAAALIAASVVFFVQTPRGTIVVEIDDDTLQATLTKTGAIIRGAEKSKEINVTPADDQTLEVTLKDPGGEVRFKTDQFQLKNGDRITLKVKLLPGSVQVVQGDKILGQSPRPLAAGIAPADERAVAAWILSVGGGIRVVQNNVSMEVSPGQNLPKGDWFVDAVWLNHRPVTDADVAKLVGLPRLGLLGLQDTQISDAALETLTKIESLGTLSLAWSRVTDAGMDAVSRMENLHGLDLRHTKVGDAGVIKVLRALGPRKLVSLELASTPVTDAALVELEKHPSFTLLDLSSCKVTEAGISRVVRLRNWNLLNLDLTPVTDEHIKALVGCNLTHLGLKGAKLKSAGFAALGQFKNLQSLRIDGMTNESVESIVGLMALTRLEMNAPALTDQGIEKLARLKNLESLTLERVQMTDGGLKALAGLKLKNIDLRETKATREGVVAFLAAMPGCSVSLDNRVISSTARSDRTAAANEPNERSSIEWVLAKGGDVRFEKDGKSVVITAMKDLPASDWRPRHVNLVSNEVNDANLKELFGLTGIAGLSLFRADVSDAGVKELVRFKDLTYLELSFCKRITGSTLKDLAPLKLDLVGLKETGVGDDALASLAAIPSLRYVSLNSTPVTPAGLRCLAGHGQLVALTLDKTSLTDDVLKEFAANKGLVHLSIGGTKVTAAGLEHLAAFENLANLELVGHDMTDARLAALPELPNLRDLVLNDNKITNPGNLVRFKKLRSLCLNNNPVGDAEILSLRGLKLETLEVKDTKVTEKGLTEFRAAVPGCRILLKDRTIEPTLKERSAGD